MGAINAVTVPKWGMAMEEGTLVGWIANEGDEIHPGDELLELESSKIINALEAEVAGTLRRRVAREGDTLPVGALLAVIADGDVPDAAIDAFLKDFTPEEEVPVSEEPSAAPAKTAASAAVVSGEPAAGSGNTPVITETLETVIPESLTRGEDDSAVPATPHARRFAKKCGINLDNIPGSGRHERVLVRDIEQAIIEAGGSIVRSVSSLPLRIQRQASTRDDSGIVATPHARRLAKQLGINLHDCRPSGAHGRVCEADVQAARQRFFGDVSPKIPSAPARAAAPVQPTGGKAVAMSGTRQIIAQRLQQAKREIPHFRLSIDTRLDNLLAFREQLNAAHSGGKVSINDILIKACAKALMEVPECNVQFAGDSVYRFANADISVAVALEAGLITPIVKAANTKTISQISEEVRRLINKAKANALRKDEFEGGTFTLSNLGMHGIKQFDAIINPPQCAILAVGGAEERIVVNDGKASVANMMTLTLSLDHRVIDGALGAKFLHVLKHIIETAELENS